MVAVENELEVILILPVPDETDDDDTESQLVDALQIVSAEAVEDERESRQDVARTEEEEVDFGTTAPYFPATDPVIRVGTRDTELLGGFTETSLADESFDTAFEHTLLEHVADPLRVVQEMHRVLRPDRVIGLADGDWETMVIEPVVPDMVEGLALNERVWRHNSGNSRFGRHQHALLRQAGFRYGETMVQGFEVTPERSAFIDELFLSPRIANLAFELGWADRPTLERYAQGVRTWAQQPDALLITAALTTVGWRLERND